MALGILMILVFQRIGVGFAYAYIIPGAVVWIGLMVSGAHPALAGVVLGLMTPVLPDPMREHPVESVWRIAGELRSDVAVSGTDAHRVEQLLRQLRLASREILPPIVRVQTALHPWVAFGIMPLFALANAGVSLKGVDLSVGGAQFIVLGVGLALVAGKPLGVIGATWLMVKLGGCRLASGRYVGWRFPDRPAGRNRFHHVDLHRHARLHRREFLGAAKLGVLLGSLVAAMLGLGWGRRIHSTLAQTQRSRVTSLVCGRIRCRRRQSE